MKKNNYIQAPLPFQGQKRNMIKEIQTFAQQQPPDTIFVDLFGGSGLVSHTIKTVMPESRVIFNDFDNYSQRLKNINTTNKILSELRTITTNTPKNTKLSETVRNEVIHVLKTYENNGFFVDYITISSNICHTLHYTTNLIQTQKERLYNRIVQKTYNATNYLKGVETVCSDYNALFHTYKDNPRFLFIFDPPYLQTSERGYYNKKMWSLKDYLNVLTCLVNIRFCYFTSSKSDIIELIKWFNSITYLSIQWKQYTQKNMAGYTDYMFVNS